MGVHQSSTKSLPVFYPSLSRSVSSKETGSPPPGYIALPITSNKQKELFNRETNRERLESNSSVCEPSPKREQEPPKQDSREPSPPKATEVEHSAPRDTRSAVYEYISRIIKENKAMAGFLPNQLSTSSTGNTNPYSVLRNPAMMASFVRSQSCSFPLAQDDKNRYARTNGNTVPTDGYIHVPAG